MNEHIWTYFLTLKEQFSQRWKYALLTKGEVKWPDIFQVLFCVFIDREKVDTYTHTYIGGTLKLIKLKYYKTYAKAGNLHFSN